MEHGTLHSINRQPEVLFRVMGGASFGGEQLAGVPLVVPGKDDDSPELTGEVCLAPLRALLPVVPAWLQLLPALQ